MGDLAQTFGQELPDQLGRIQAAVDVHLDVLNDIREYLKERIALERHYGATLQGIVKKAMEKRSRKEQALSVGMEPSKTWSGGGGGGNTVDEAWSRILSEADEEASDHTNLADQLQNEICEPLKTTERKKEAVCKKHSEFAIRLTDDRDKVYASKDKAKRFYDDCCTSLESSRVKQESAKDDRAQEKAAKSFETHTTDMHAAKNAYLVSLSVASQAKSRFFQADLPSVQNDFQVLWSMTTGKLVRLLNRMTTLAGEHFDALQAHNQHSVTAIGSISAKSDQVLFIEFNQRPFFEPPDFTFEPCAIWHDSEGYLLSSPQAKTLLQNRLAASRSKVEEFGPQIEIKQKELVGLRKLREAYEDNEALGDVDEVLDNLMEAERGIMVMEALRTGFIREVEVLEEVLGDDQGSQQPHTFKPASFVTPTPCNLCRNSIWGIAKQGATCKTCGFHAHLKCQPKVPADCPGTAPPPNRRRNNISTTASPASSTYRQSYVDPSPTSPVSGGNGLSSLSLARAASTASRTPTTAASRSPKTTGTMLYAYDATTAFEVSVGDGESVAVVDPDDGSGWCKIETGDGRKGLVPSTYVQLGSGVEERRLPPVVPARMKKGKKAKVLFEWQAQSPDEHSLAEGEYVILSEGGDNYSDGWYEIEKEGRKGIIPSNYVELV